MTVLHRALIGIVGLVSFSATAGVQSPCSDPLVLAGPKVQVFILPYRAEGILTARGRELATIVQRHVLFAALKYRSIAVSELTGEPKLCSPEKAMARVHQQLANGQAAVFLWGRLFEQGESIRLQSTAAFSMRGSADTMEWNLGGDAGSASATVPAEPVLFAPRQIPLNFVQMLEPAQRAARRFHSEPNAASSHFDLPNDPDARFGYQVLEVRDDWMHIRLFPAGGQGWIPAYALASADNLKGTFPELYFIDGLIGYYQLWGVPNRPAGADNQRLLELTRRSFGRYSEQAAGRAESEVRALATLLVGNATLRAAGTAGWPTDLLQQAQTLYRQAQQLAPTSTAASNFYLACSFALCARGECAEGPDRLHQQYLSAIARDPTSAELIDNLDEFYGAAQRGRLTINATSEQIAAQRAHTSRMRRQMR